MFLPTPWQGCLILDGGLATELEARGHDLSSALWSAQILEHDPSAIREAHRRYLDAGADVITTATYQASFQGFSAAGISPERAEELLQLGVRLAVEARDQFWAPRAEQGPRGAPKGRTPHANARIKSKKKDVGGSGVSLSTRVKPGTGKEVPHSDSQIRKHRTLRPW